MRLGERKKAMDEELDWELRGGGSRGDAIVEVLCG